MKLQLLVLAFCIGLSSSAPSLPALSAFTPTDAERCVGVRGYADSFDGRRTFVWRPEWLNLIKTEESAHELRERIVANAEDSWAGSAPSVVTKTTMPPSGDRHDFFSWPVYWWRVGANGYESQDGHQNPDTMSDKFDTASFKELQLRVTYLSLGYFITDDHRYSTKAAALLAAWFLDPATAMNPNLNFGQMVPGKRPPTTIETSQLISVIEAIGLLDSSGDLAPDRKRALQAWFSRYLDWMLGPITRDDQRANNNHGLAYDLQLIEFALFAGRFDVGEAVVRQLPARLVKQISSDGHLPSETARKRGLFYSIYALGLLFQLAALGECFDVDLWAYQHDGAGIRAALDFLVPFVGHEEAWLYSETKEREGVMRNRELFRRLLMQASWVYNAPEYFEYAESLEIGDVGRDIAWWSGIAPIAQRPD